MADFAKQQRLAKDSLRALEALSDTYEREKRELVARLERDRDEALRREEAKFETKAKELRQNNEKT